MKYTVIYFAILLCFFNVKTEVIQPSPPQPPPPRILNPLDFLVKLKEINRNLNGTENNLKNPKWGSVNSDL